MPFMAKSPSHSKEKIQRQMHRSMEIAFVLITENLVSGLTDCDGKVSTIISKRPVLSSLRCAEHVPVAVYDSWPSGTTGAPLSPPPLSLSSGLSFSVSSVLASSLGRTACQWDRPTNPDIMCGTREPAFAAAMICKALERTGVIRSIAVEELLPSSSPERRSSCFAFRSSSISR